MKAPERREKLRFWAAWGGFFLVLLPMDLVWAPAFLVIKLSVNAVSAMGYAVVLAALRDRCAEPVPYGSILFVLGLVTIPCLLLLPVFYYTGLTCAALPVVLTIVLLVDWLRTRKE